MTEIAAAPAAVAGKHRARPTPIVPPANVAGRALLTVIAIMTFLASLTLGAVTLVADTAADWQSQIAREVTIQIRPDDGLDMADALGRIEALARATPGVTGAQTLDDAATARLLEPWLGSGLDLDDLPVPRLVIVSIDESSPPDFTALAAAVRASVPQASLDDHRAWVSRLVSMAHATVLIGVAILALVMVATILTVVFATRGAMSGNRHIIEVLHFVGARGTFIAAEFQRHFLRLGLLGALAGGVAALLVFLLIGRWTQANQATPEADQISALFGSFAIGWTGYGGVLFLIVLIGGLTAVTSRWTVTRQLAAIDMLSPVER
ncbi:cell division protein FtsX [Aureimonas jatrophae]|uniref:Cell division transport system permease protein n=1 Tax=Aureimonas jatrophae TaxID=1166073 RepID=A0A1H0ID25_9HYPH|nr:ABC transporter permease [Aureimonas jatrophae]MBB3952088.1 cell division transport system permease protein [Aureimonas jatrophae]SDO28971.1 cell division transport system permease protein [Aureimonas jatrophae]